MAYKRCKRRHDTHRVDQKRKNARPRRRATRPVEGIAHAKRSVQRDQCHQVHNPDRNEQTRRRAPTLAHCTPCPSAPSGLHPPPPSRSTTWSRVFNHRLSRDTRTTRSRSCHANDSLLCTRNCITNSVIAAVAETMTRAPGLHVLHDQTFFHQARDHGPVFESSGHARVHKSPERRAYRLPVH